MHPAPGAHKPLLLLCALDLVAEEAVVENFFEPGADLVEPFALYWSRVTPPDRRGTVAFPFFHLRSEGFWHLVPAPGRVAHLGALAGRTLLGPSDEALWPAPGAGEWHRREVFRRR